MLNDIFATSMGGHFQTTSGGAVVEGGTWSYRGYGSAEIAMTAESTLADGGIRYAIDIHSAERQLDAITMNVWGKDGGEKLRLGASIAGHQIELLVKDGDAERSGTLTVPDETVYNGPSPIWFVHLFLASPPPADRTVVTPFVALGLHADAISSGFYRVTRAGEMVTMELLNNDGETQSTIEVTLSDDGCPTLIRSGKVVTEIVRVPQSLAQ